MENISLCRFCLFKDPEKELTELKSQQSEHTCVDILLFCLNLKIEEDSKVSTKCCMKCFKKVMSFYKFKMLALRSDAYLKTLETRNQIKNEVFLSDDIKNEEISSCISDVEDSLDALKIEPINDELDHSDNELLSFTKDMKLEFIGEPIDATKENEPENKANDNGAVKPKGKRGRPPSLKKTKTTSVPRVCEECGKTVKNLSVHLLMHRPDVERKIYTCKVCDKTFKSKSACYRHNQIKHLGQKKSCPICHKSVVNVRTHTRTMHDSASLEHSCACGRRFISRSARDEHAATHSTERPHACDLCDKSFRSKTVMQQHRRQVHDKEKKLLCQFCSKSFFKTYHLQVHLRTHTKEKPYECKQCGKRFSSCSILRNHELTHSKVKMFSCTLCSMAFVRSGYLRAHMISHSKEKKHPCKYCGVKFGRSDHRKRHEHTAHERHVISNN